MTVAASHVSGGRYSEFNGPLLPVACVHGGEGVPVESFRTSNFEHVNNIIAIGLF